MSFGHLLYGLHTTCEGKYLCLKYLHSNIIFINGLCVVIDTYKYEWLNSWKIVSFFYINDLHRKFKICLKVCTLYSLSFETGGISWSSVMSFKVRGLWYKNMQWGVHSISVWKTNVGSNSQLSCILLSQQKSIYTVPFMFIIPVCSTVYRFYCVCRDFQWE